MPTTKRPRISLAQMEQIARELSAELGIPVGNARALMRLAAAQMARDAGMPAEKVQAYLAAFAQ